MAAIINTNIQSLNAMSFELIPKSAGDLHATPVIGPAHQ